MVGNSLLEHATTPTKSPQSILPLEFYFLSDAAVDERTTQHFPVPPPHANKALIPGFSEVKKKGEGPGVEAMAQEKTLPFGKPASYGG